MLLPILLMVTAAVIFVMNEAGRRKNFPDSLSAAAVIFSFALLPYYAAYYTVSGIFILSIIITLFTFKINSFNSSDEEKKRRKFALWFLAAGIILFILFGRNNIIYFSFPLFLLAFHILLSDIIHNHIPLRRFYVNGVKKSVGASLILFLLSAASIYSVTSYLGYAGRAALFTALPLAAVIVIVETLSSPKILNFTIPVSSGFLLFILLQGDHNTLIDFNTGVILGLFIGYASYIRRFLTKDGALATAVLASVVYGFGGWQFTLPMITFFLLSSILSKIRPARRNDADIYFEKSGTRDYMQVIANGGIAGIIVMAYGLYNLFIFYYIYTGVLAAVCADTWATEIGTLKKARTYNIIGFSPVEQGRSGGISVPGTTGAAAGSVVIALSALPWINIPAEKFILFILVAGLAGSFADSLLGAALQVQYKCRVCSRITEKRSHCGLPADKYRGLNFLNNDVVNILAGITGGSASLLLFYLF